MEYKDFFDKEIKVGSKVIYTVRDGNTAILKEGVVHELSSRKDCCDNLIPTLRLRTPYSERIIAFSTLENCVVI